MGKKPAEEALGPPGSGSNGQLGTRLGHGHGFGREPGVGGRDLRQGGLERLGSALLVDAFGPGGPIGEHGNNVLFHLDKTAIYIKPLDAPVPRNAQLAIAKPPNQRCPAGADAEFTVVKRQGDKLHDFVEQRLLRCDD